MSDPEEYFPERELSEAEAKRLHEIIEQIKRGGCKFDYFDPAELLKDD